MIYYRLTFFLLVTEMLVFGILVVSFKGKRNVAGTQPLHLVATSFTLASSHAQVHLQFPSDTINRLQRIEIEAQEEQAHHHDYSYETSLKVKKFYAQRNLYLTGFTLFLSLILERTSTLIIQVLKHEEALEHVKKENTSAAKDQQRLAEMESSYKKEIDELTKAVNELKRQERDYEVLKKQAAQQQVEYNRLADERNALERLANGQPIEGKKGV
ncbi:hypothetical protein EC973_009025 [Apophysomyces ossiformis]|uniref:Endoplasmic reticulum transmembrane protein n=1 Tax=Apophysomyces ossiformis TaxID=679940 RepID=A0A8H7BW60_9FUNG|nr:hypothetical protein EC973_009025 [Apophysomyces ossiformis]